MSLITYLTAIRFGEGVLSGVGQDLAELGIRSPLIVTDGGVRAAGLLDRLRSTAPALVDAPVFDDVPGNPTEAATLAALAAYREHRCDGLIAIGGGSPIDLAKGVALLATHACPLEQYALILGGLTKITAAVAPLIAIPTTAGTGSEVGRGALITLDDGRKLGFISPHLIPKRAVCDPELTYGLPPRLTAATGIDAITHCIETYLSPRDNPTAEAIALDGLGRAVRHIERAVADGADRTARREMMIAALHGGLTFQKGLGAVHALSHPLGGYKDLALHHGMLNGVLLPAALRRNEAAAPGKFGTLAAVLGASGPQAVAGHVGALVARLGLPRSLNVMGVPEAILDAVADAALLDHSSATNATPLTRDDYRALLAEAFV